MNLNPLRGAKRSRLHRGLAVGAVAVLGAGSFVVLATQASAAAGCRATYTASSWSTGFSGNLSVTNLGDAISGGWTITFSFPSGQQITQSWSGQATQSGSNVTITNESWNASIPTNGSVNPGFNGTHTGTNTAPTSFSLNGVACTGQTGTDPTANPTSNPTTNPTGNPSAKVDNPYAGGKGYVNSEWVAKAAAEPNGSRVASIPTGVWIDRIAAIEGTAGSTSNGPMGVRDHLDAALAQGATYIQFVIYNLPGRDCAALASNGELGPTELGRYKTEYIDPIAAIQADAKYASLRIVNIIEIDSLPNLVTNTGSRETATANCDTMKANGNYVNGVGYALAKLGAIGNVYNYIDAAHHGWIGWDDNFNATATLMAEAAKASGSTVNMVHGFITNTANYSPTTEPFLTVTEANRQSDWIDWNRYTSELPFAQAFRNQLVSAGFPSTIGMLIDTSRNGWGGPDRPTAASTASDVNTQVNDSRIDRRAHKGNWCNQAGAGMGVRPTAAPASGIDAYVWIKPPGESDGSSTLIENDEGKGFDQMCDPTYEGNPRNGNSPTSALSGAPISGAWFSAQFRELMANAYPAW